MSGELIYVEMDVPTCEHEFGVSPCAATGEKCRKTAATCRDINNYSGTVIQTLRWVTPAAYLPAEPYAVPNLKNVGISSQRINPGENLGKRERVTITLSNHPHSDVDFDPYVQTRSYNPYKQGTYWGKLSAIHPNMQGYPVRVIRGNSSLNYDDLDVDHYICESGKISGDKIAFTISAKDVLDLSEGNKSLCPPPGEGRLATAITASSTSVSLLPIGVGAKYPLTFDASIGDESVRCTRVGDLVYFAERGAFFSVAANHDADDTLQPMVTFDATPPWQVLFRLLSHTSTPPEWYNVAQWAEQDDLVAAPNITARIAHPTEVVKLLDDFMRELAIDIHADSRLKKIVTRYLINQMVSAELNDNIIDRPSAKLHDDKRVDLFVINFGRKNPLLKMDEQSNYPAAIVRPTSNPVALAIGSPPAIRTHYSRFLSSFLRAQASQTAEFIVGRYEIAPRGLTCTVPESLAPSISQIISVTTSVFESESGETATIPMQVVSVSRAQGNCSVEMEEFRAVEFDNGGDIIVSLTVNQLNMSGFANLRALYNSLYSNPPASGRNVVFAADAGIIYGSNTVASFSVIVGDWPAGVNVFIDNLYIAGKGGESYPNVPYSSILYPENGGGGLYTRRPVTLRNCTVQGGGGGGNGWTRTNSGSAYWAGEAGGAGSVVGRTTATIPFAGDFDLATLTTGGRVRERFYNSPEKTTFGGAPGMPGIAADPANFPNVGQGGIAIDGIAFVTNIGSTIVGATV